MFKFKLMDKIFYLRNNKVHSAPVLARRFVDTQNPTSNSEIYERFGEPNISYSTCHGIVPESEAFASKEDLLASL
jgi:hypothetical protein